MDASLDAKLGLRDRRVGSRLGRLAVLLIAAVVVLSLPACGNGASRGSTLPSNVILTLGARKKLNKTCTSGDNYLSRLLGE